DLLHRRDHVRRVSREALRAAAPSEAYGQGGPLRAQDRPRLLRLYRPEEARADEARLNVAVRERARATRKLRTLVQLSPSPPAPLRAKLPADLTANKGGSDERA